MLTVKRIAGMVPCASSDSILSSLHLDGELSELEIANKITSALLASMEIFQPVEAVAPYKDDPYICIHSIGACGPGRPETTKSTQSSRTRLCPQLAPAWVRQGSCRTSNSNSQL